MSAAQAAKDKQMQKEIERMEEEKERLLTDLEKIDKAIEPAKSAAEIFQFVQSKEDPFTSVENDWTKAEGGACCIVM